MIKILKEYRIGELFQLTMFRVVRQSSFVDQENAPSHFLFVMELTTAGMRVMNTTVQVD